MPNPVFVNLPVADVARATAFYAAIGCTMDQRFSGPTASAMVFSESLTFMLLHHDFFQSFTPRAVADASAVTEVLIALPLDDRAAVDALVEKAAGAGGSGDIRPVQDMGFMYGRSFTDPDGHIFEPFHMDMAAAAAAMAPAEPA
ncbi:VOC family protein [Sphingomonas sp. HT-1]|uniref:VOC family protein n=1 Tax=unclassified Sphingomonas TaxID=196159 RepID=UPI00031F2FFA|nr:MULTISPECIES: VOC family protein [unclassified Sphingomonas]KTF68866.1 lactoylglutathione lyase [Sphingomonas sp. WG]